MRAAHLTLRALACFAAAGLAGCVTEVVPVTNSRGGPATGPLNTTPPVNATPAPGGATSTSRVAAAIKPIGALPYDGLTLPLVTPDGRWIVTQTGSIPSWEAVLAERGAAPVPANAVAAFEIVDGTLRAAPWSQGRTVTDDNIPLADTTGLLLGRAGGDGYVLVERPNLDGSRWIGKLDLVSGTVEWLVQGEAVNAQAILLRDRTLIFTRRAVDQVPSELVIQPQSAGNPASGESLPPPRVVRREGWKFCQPITTPDQSIVAVLAISARESELLAYSTTAVDAAGTPLLVGRQTLGPMSAAAAFQAVTSIEACPPDVDSSLRTSVLLMNGERGRLAVWDPIRGTMNLMPSNVMAAARVQSGVASGMVMASSRGMDFWTGTSLPVRLIAGSYIPRSYGSASGTRLVLLSPQPDSPVPALRLVALELVAPNP